VNKMRTEEKNNESVSYNALVAAKRAETPRLGGGKKEI